MLLSVAMETDRVGVLLWKLSGCSSPPTATPSFSQPTPHRNTFERTHTDRHTLKRSFIYSADEVSVSNGQDFEIALVSICCSSSMDQSDLSELWLLTGKQSMFGARQAKPKSTVKAKVGSTIALWTTVLKA